MSLGASSSGGSASDVRAEESGAGSGEAVLSSVADGAGSRPGRKRSFRRTDGVCAPESSGRVRAGGGEEVLSSAGGEDGGSGEDADGDPEADADEDGSDAGEVAFGSGAWARARLHWSRMYAPAAETPAPILRAALMTRSTVR
ncbi:hypothetical protein SARU107417_05890 [Salinibacter ruber]